MLAGYRWADDFEVNVYNEGLPEEPKPPKTIIGPDNWSDKFIERRKEFRRKLRNRELYIYLSNHAIMIDGRLAVPLFL